MMFAGSTKKKSAVQLVSITPDAEQLMGFCARVSNPANQNNPEVEKLLAYCIKNEHWSVFEMASMVLSIETSRAISAQILRHRSFSFQEFSQRYALATNALVYPARRQDVKNRQNSIDDLPKDTKEWFAEIQERINKVAIDSYEAAIKLGIAKECARFLLPMSTATTLYMNGTVRSWIHYIELRTKPGTQSEHMDLALEARNIFSLQLPTLAKALGWPEWAPPQKG